MSARPAAACDRARGTVTCGRATYRVHAWGAMCELHDARDEHVATFTARGCAVDAYATSTQGRHARAIAAAWFSSDNGAAGAEEQE